MLGIFKRRRAPEVDATADITHTMVSAFDELRTLANNPDALQRQFGMNARLAAMIGALRDTYPGLPIADDGPGMELIQASGCNDVFAAAELANSLFDLVENCPNDPNAKMNVMIFILSPASIPPGDRPQVGLLGKWA